MKLKVNEYPTVKNTQEESIKANNLFFRLFSIKQFYFLQCRIYCDNLLDSLFTVCKTMAYLVNKVIIFHCREIIQCSAHLSNKTEFSIKCCDRKKLG